ncbi:hypothetical protein GCM10011583_62110 [Streptomyces camponoticapitis]|uniref:Uncharacterized protein n=1 Tax=Streptomyces camponoticapitis TaxID=1616125 RepID=A0ABQ2ER45_9ACTN|nr:hypothetical protein GCM10011583_62110 [Streptomyces camponoticapitis]
MVIATDSVLTAAPPGAMRRGVRLFREGDWLSRNSLYRGELLSGTVTAIETSDSWLFSLR